MPDQTNPADLVEAVASAIALAPDGFGNAAQAAITAMQAYMASEGVSLDTMVNRFLAWPLPEGFAADTCASDGAYPYPRHGTNIMSANDARAMLQHVTSPWVTTEEAHVELEKMIDAAADHRRAAAGKGEAPSIQCVACEGKPAPENDPCAICGGSGKLFALSTPQPDPRDAEVEAEAQFLWDQARHKIGHEPSRLPRQRTDYRDLARAALANSEPKAEGGV